MLKAENLYLEYRDGDSKTHAVRDVTLAVEARRFIGILGPSGSGKSSLLYLLSGLRRPDGGEIYYEGRAYGTMGEREKTALRRAEFGFVFQRHFLIEYLTVLENVMVASPGSEKTHLEYAKSLLSDLGLGDKLHRFTYQLSGGERQRVAIGRALIHKPRIIFADEPTGQLDLRTGMQVTEILLKFRTEGSLVVVTHNPEILAEADLVIRMRDGAIADKEERRDGRAKEAVL